MIVYFTRAFEKIILIQKGNFYLPLTNVYLYRPSHRILIQKHDEALHVKLEYRKP